MKNTDFEKRRNWTAEQWKTSSDIIDRTVYFISYLSPHNLWKAREALINLIEEEKHKAYIEGHHRGMGAAELLK